jgi:hypothetical protein
VSEKRTGERGRRKEEGGRKDEKWRIIGMMNDES